METTELKKNGLIWYIWKLDLYDASQFQRNFWAAASYAQTQRAVAAPVVALDSYAIRLVRQHGAVPVTRRPGP